MSDDTGTEAERRALGDEMTQLESLPPHLRVAASGHAATLEQRAEALGAVDLALRAQLVQADAIARMGRTAASTRIIRDVNRWARENDHRYLLARSHRHLSQIVRVLGDYAMSLEHAVRAVELTDDTMPLTIRLDHELILGIALARTGDLVGASQRFLAMERQLEVDEDFALHVSVLNNLAYMYYLNGQPDEALDAATRMRAMAQDHAVPLLGSFVDTHARIVLAAGRPADAAAIIEESLEPAQQFADPDALADCLLTLAEARRTLGQHVEAHASLAECERVCIGRGLAEIQARVHQERAEVYAAQGLFREAYEEHKRYAAASAALYSRERDGRAKIAQAVFETAEARKESERLRLLSQHDPLTGLYNRRHVDDHLPELIATSARRGADLSVAIVDLDHFKRVNDTFSHEVGDQVLVRVAGCLERRAREPGFAARLGGEEFLLVLPGADEDEAVLVCEALLEELRTAVWDGVVPGLGSVTASVGVAALRPDGTAATQLELLREADAHLYRAKRQGRDRVVSGARTAPRPATPAAR